MPKESLQTGGPMSFEEWKILWGKGEDVSGVEIEGVALIDALPYGQVWISGSRGAVVCSGFYVDAQSCCATRIITDNSSTPAIFHYNDRLILGGKLPLEAYDAKSGKLVTVMGSDEAILGIRIHTLSRSDIMRHAAEKPGLQNPLLKALPLSQRLLEIVSNYEP